MTYGDRHWRNVSWRAELFCHWFGHVVSERPSLTGHVWKHTWCARCERYPIRFKKQRPR